MLNKVILMGRMTHEPELKYTQNNTPVVSFCIAVDRNYSGKGEERQTDFITIVAWRRTAEFVSQWFTKGQMIVVVGSIQSRRWQDKNGSNRTSIEVVADEVQFGESKRSRDAGNGYDNGYQGSYSAPQQNSAPQGTMKFCLFFISFSGKAEALKSFRFFVFTLEQRFSLAAGACKAEKIFYPLILLIQRHRRIAEAFDCRRLPAGYAQNSGNDGIGHFIDAAGSVHDPGCAYIDIFVNKRFVAAHTDDRNNGVIEACRAARPEDHVRAHGCKVYACRAAEH